MNDASSRAKDQAANNARLEGNKRYVGLYHLAKPSSQLRDKKADEIEYEKNCDECTFNPDLGITRKYGSTKS